ncbi:PKD domain-containing protein [Phaeodactylibacter xiamenensis]|jgi:PKD repeat protein|uniref:PKD domain-containing protein n=1 Tax=Phaeodactylibacter xiamenensis TaxID=1524460 RepID=A0A098SBJ4_9BACT|nr:PKD domain-containing protein [Phaeodactylibacter xiamenensis]KGE89844.1 hypothetical protein IX84_00600 [Phaeodactylibacter xiamenensis]MCR9054995.1 PKD domain-containing protein [bacterium]
MKLKSSILLLFFGLLSIGATAQITLTADDIPDFGEVYANAVDTLLTSVDVGPASADAQTWSFLNFDADEVFTNTVVMPSETPAADLFPTATFAFEGSNELYSFAEVTSDALFAAGGSAPGPDGTIFTVAFENQQQLLPLPATYGAVFEDEFSYRLEIDGGTFGADSVRLIGGGTVEAEVDAFGEITVPAGTFEVLRQRSVITTADSIYVKIFGSFILIDVIENTTVSYEWWGADGVGTVCSVDFDVDGNPISATYLAAINPSDQPPVADFSAELLSDGQVQFTDASTNMPLSWSWDFGDGNAGTEQNPLHTYSAPGTYTVCLTATNLGGSDISCQEVVVILPPTASFTFEDQGEGTLVFTDASANNPTEWFWDFSDGNSSTLQNPTHTYTANNTYNVCLTAMNSAGSDISCTEISVVVVSADGFATVAFANAFPSPAADWLRIDFGAWQGRPVTLNAFGVNGQQIFSRDLKQTPASFEVDVTEWAAGMYYLRIQGEGQVQTLPVTVR